MRYSNKSPCDGDDVSKKDAVASFFVAPVYLLGLLVIIRGDISFKPIEIKSILQITF